jgi:hypothetical protein
MCPDWHAQGVSCCTHATFTLAGNSVKYPQIVFFLVLVAVGLGVFRDYGISWDEPPQRLSGLVTFKYIAERFAPSLLPEAVSRVAPLDNYADRDHGVAFEAPAVALEIELGIGDEKNVFMFRHMLTFLVFLAGIYAFQRMADRRFSDWRIGLLAGLFMVLTPRFFAEAFYNSKDIVFMAVFAIAMNTMIAFVLKPSFKTAFLHALASAVAIDVRIMAVILPTATVAVIIGRLLKRELPIANTCQASAVYLASACILIIAMWPWLWSDPIGHFVEAFRRMSKYPWDSDVLYMGRLVPSTDLPWHYVPVWISITTPVLYLALFVVGAFNTIRHIVSRRISLWNGDKELQDVIFLVLFAAPIAAVILMHSVLYDGWRHLYFIYPAFLLVAMEGWVSLWGKSLVWTIRKSVLAATTAISLAYTGVWMWKAHPFQNVYFNTFAGTDLRTRYELDYWGLANRKALEYILRNDDSEVITVRADSFTPLSTSFKMIDTQEKRRLRYSKYLNLSQYVLTNYRLVTDPDDAKYATNYDLFYQIRVDDEVILSVFRRKPA